MAYLFQRSGGEFVANSVTAGDQVSPKSIRLASGGFMIVWTDYSDPNDAGNVKAQIYDGAGIKVGGELLVNTSTVAYQNSPAAVGLADGSFVITWQTRAGFDANLTWDVMAQRFDAGGTKIGGEFLVSSDTAGNQNFPQIAAAGAGFAIMWLEGSHVEGRIFDQTGAAIGGDFAVTNYQGSSGDLKLTNLADGRLVAVWDEGAFGSVVKAQIFSAAGAKEGGEIVVDPNSISQGQLQLGLTALSSGGFVVAWNTNNEDGSGGGVAARIFDGAGNAVGAEFQVNTTTAGNQGQPSVIGLPGGGFLISWAESSVTGLIRSVVKAQAFDGTGTKVGSEFLVSVGTDSANQNHNHPSLALLDSGNVVAAWHGAGPGDPRTPGTQPPDYDGGIRAQIFAPAGAVSLDIVPSKTNVSEIAVEEILAIRLSTASAAANGNYTYSLLADSSGGAFELRGNQLFVIDNGKLDFETAPVVDLTLRSTDQNGNSVDEILHIAIGDATPEPRYSAGAIATVNTQFQSDQVDAAITKLASGGFLVTWTDQDFSGDGTGYSIKVQLYDSAGNRVGGEFVANTQGNSIQESPAVTALVSGGFAIAWTDYSNMIGDSSTGIAAQVFDSAGNKVGSELLVNTTTSGMQLSPAIDSLPGGGFVVSWADYSATGGDTSGSAIRAQRFDAAGAKVGGELLVNSTIAGSQFEPTVAVLAGGGFVISWTDPSATGGDTSSNAVRAQLFDAAGAKVGGEFLVNTITASSQTTPVAIALGSGFVIVWGDSNLGIEGQLFDSAGNKVGGQFAVDSVTRGFQPTIAAMPSGGFVVSWTATSTLDDSGTAVMAQMFDGSGQKLGDEFLLAGGVGNQGAATITVLGSGAIAAAWMNGSLGFSADIAGRLLVPSEAPLAFADAFVTDEASSVTGNVFVNNGSGADGGSPLQVVAVNGSAASVGQTIALPSGALINLAANGALTYNPNGALNYLVPAGSGASSEKAFETFTYTLAGGSTATVTVRVNGLASAGDQYRGSTGSDVITGTPGSDLFLIQQGGYDVVSAGGG
ncbi:MAG: hypothetical protein ABWX67_16110, partial [Allosphingosinicella sp.]